VTESIDEADSVMVGGTRGCEVYDRKRAALNYGGYELLR
jgi:hypothetical protein